MSITPVSLFIRATDALVKFNAHFLLIKSDDHNTYSLQIQASDIRKLWSKVKSTYDKCMDYLTTLDGAQLDDIDSTDEKYNSSYRVYVDCLSSINQRLDEIKVVEKASHSPAADHSSVSEKTQKRVPPPDSQSVESLSDMSDRQTVSSIVTPLQTITTSKEHSDSSTHNLNLPPCDIDVFHGDFMSWLTFRDLFTAIFINYS